MTKEITIVFQDCALCGVKGRQKIADYSKKGIAIRKVSFISEEGRELCAEAVKKGIGSMPFYVSGDDFATNIEALIVEKPAKKSRKSQKQPKKVEGKEDGTDSEV